MQGYIVGSCAVDHINYSLVTPVNRQMQSEGYEWRISLRYVHLMVDDLISNRL